MSLRPYQSKLITDIHERWQAGARRVLAQLPTGGGKTHIFSEIIRARPGRSLVLAHREELITQAAAKLTEATGERVGIVKAGFPFEPSHRLQVASVQTLVNRLQKVGSFDLVVTDEAHHATAPTYQRILNRYSSAYQLGVSATPIRADGTGFDDTYDALVCGPSVSELINQGHLCKYRLIADKQQMTTRGVKTTAGDYNAKQLAAANDAVELAGSIVGSYRERAMGKRAIVFAINCEHSRAITSAYNQAGIAAAHLDGDSTPDERKAALSAFAAGDLQVLSNVGLFTEGFDLPSIEVVQIARPTKSLGLWLQMLGRGLRTAPGKDESLLIDHTSNWARLGSPTRPRVWTLQGVEVKPVELVRKPNGEVVEAEPLIIAERPAELIEIIQDPLEEWRDVWHEILETAKERNYKPAWVGFQLEKITPHPPLEIWELAASQLGYRKGWAWHKWKATQAA